MFAVPKKILYESHFAIKLLYSTTTGKTKPDSITMQLYLQCKTIICTKWKYS